MAKKGWFQKAREATTYDEVTGSDHVAADEGKIKRMAKHFWDRTGTGPVSQYVYTGGPVRRFMRRRAVGTKVAHELEGERYQDLKANPYKVVKDMVKGGELPVHPRDRKKLKEAFALILAEKFVKQPSIKTKKWGKNYLWWNKNDPTQAIGPTSSFRTELDRPQSRREISARIRNNLGYLKDEGKNKNELVKSSIKQDVRNDKAQLRYLRKTPKAAKKRARWAGKRAKAYGYDI